MSVQEMRDLTGDELRGRLTNLKEELFNLRFQAATGQLDNPMRIRVVRKDIARVMTIMREREISSKRA